MITSSAIVEDAAQIDGRRHVCERHIDDLDGPLFVRYIAESGDNVASSLAARATRIASDLLEQEQAANDIAVLGDGDCDAPNLTFRRITAVQYAQRLRAAFSGATGFRAIRIGLQLAKLTDPQLRTLFGYNAAQTTALRTKLTGMQTLVSNAKSQAGE